MWKLNRNNTSFPKQLYENIKKIEWSQEEPLRYHQKIVHEYFINYILSGAKNIRGILAYHSLGSGKSILSAAIAVSVLLMKKYKVIFMSAKTLHANFRNDALKYIRLLNEKNENKISEEILDNIYFITINAINVIKKIQEVTTAELEIETDVSLPSLDNTFIIIDEAHNFFNSITNGAKLAIELYNLIMAAKNIKLLFLSGSPIVNTPFEILICYNMLNGFFSNGKTLFSEYYEDFVIQFIEKGGENPDDEDLRIKNGVKFANRILGLTSYFNAITSEIAAQFPKLLEIKIIKVPMSEKQYTFYLTARDKEIEESKKAAFYGKKTSALSKPQSLSSSYRIRSRQFSNFTPPEGTYEVFRDVGLKYIFHLDKLNKDHFTIESLKELSPKILELLKNISSHLKEGLEEFRKERLGIGPGLIYSQFLEFGILIIAKILKYYGMKEVKNEQETGSKTFCIISGEVKVETREELIRLYNLPANRDGSIISLMLFSSTGAEGISAYRTRHVHVFEPFWHDARINQVLYRAVRMGGHIDLPEEDRNVQPYIYLSDHPSGVIGKEDTTDIILYQKSIQNRIFIDQFRKLMQDSAIDCLIHTKKDCKICNPTDVSIFLEDIYKDLNNPDNCGVLKEEKIKARSIIIKEGEKEKEFMFTGTKDDLHIFEYNTELGGYKEIDISHPLYEILYKKILEII